MFSAVHVTYRTPYVSTWIAGFFVGIPAGIWDIDTFAELSNIGTLFAFIVVSAGVIVLTLNFAIVAAYDSRECRASTESF